MKIYHKITILLLWILPLATIAQQWQWASISANREDAYITGLATNPDGTIMGVGYTKNYYTHVGPATIICRGCGYNEENVFVFAYSPEGKLINTTPSFGFHSSIGGGLGASGIHNTTTSGYYINAGYAGSTYFDTIYVNDINTATVRFNNRPLS